MKRFLQPYLFVMHFSDLKQRGKHFKSIEKVIFLRLNKHLVVTHYVCLYIIVWLAWIINSTMIYFFNFSFYPKFGKLNVGLAFLYFNFEKNKKRSDFYLLDIVNVTKKVMLYMFQYFVTNIPPT
ncbi:hypothetical protein S83_043428 [Arachis hypogaea]